MSVCCLSFCLGWWLRASPVGGKVSSCWHILAMKRNNLCKQGPGHPVSEQRGAAFGQGVLWQHGAGTSLGTSIPAKCWARSGGSNFSSACPITSLEGKLCWTPRGSVMRCDLHSSSSGSLQRLSPWRWCWPNREAVHTCIRFTRKMSGSLQPHGHGHSCIGTRNADQPAGSVLLLWEGFPEISKTKNSMWAGMQGLRTQ